MHRMILHLSVSGVSFLWQCCREGQVMSRNGFGETDLPLSGNKRVSLGEPWGEYIGPPQGEGSEPEYVAGLEDSDVLEALIDRGMTGNAIQQPPDR